jgi:hypothetical protein
MKSSKVKKVVSIKDWNSPNGVIKYHLLEMENGDKINIGKKKELAIGDSIDYEIIGDPGQHEYTKAKTAKKDFKPSFDAKGIEVGHALNNAVNLICAGVELSSVDAFKNNEEKIYKYAKVIMAIAKKLKDE